MSSRCGRPVRRKEQAGVAVLEDPVCGRRENHPGRCRSVAAMERARRADVKRGAARGRHQRSARDRARRLHENLSVVIAAAVARAERDAGLRDAASCGWPASRSDVAA